MVWYMQQCCTEQGISWRVRKISWEDVEKKEGTQQEVEKQNALKDPPIGEGKSVPKGKRMKHPTEPTVEEKKKKAKEKEQGK